MVSPSRAAARLTELPARPPDSRAVPVTHRATATPAATVVAVAAAATAPAVATALVVAAAVTTAARARCSQPPARTAATRHASVPPDERHPLLLRRLSTMRAREPQSRLALLASRGRTRPAEPGHNQGPGSSADPCSSILGGRGPLALERRSRRGDLEVRMFPGAPTGRVDAFFGPPRGHTIAERRSACANRASPRLARLHVDPANPDRFGPPALSQLQAAGALRTERRPAVRTMPPARRLVPIRDLQHRAVTQSGADVLLGGGRTTASSSCSHRPSTVTRSRRSSGRMAVTTSSNRPTRWSNG